MSFIILSNFGTRIYGSLVSEIFQPTDTIAFVSNSTYINSSSDFISYPNSNNIVKNGSGVLYYTSPGYTSITGENNAIYYTTSANTTGTKLAYANGATVNLTSVANDLPGHFLVPQNPAYYITYSKHTEWDDDLNPDQPVDNFKSVYDFNSEMMIGKKIRQSDFAYMIRRVDWESNTVYSFYDDQATNLSNSDFYVVNSSNNIYKCISNYGGAASTQEPTQVSTNTFMTSDGYKWKYMYTLSTANNAKFSTDNYIPVDANVIVSALAVNGSIEHIEVVESGNGYIATTNGLIQEVISNNTFRISNTDTSATNGYYTNNSFYVANGTGVGQLSVISNYIVNTSGRYVVTSDTLLSLSTTSGYKILPQIQIYGDGVGAKAIPVINSITYGIDSIDVVSKGYNYSFAEAYVRSQLGYGSGAVVRPIMSPPGGHGYNPFSELQSFATCLAVSVANTEGNTLPTALTFRKMGLVVDPKVYGNAQLSYVSNTFNAMTKLEITPGPISFTNNELITGLLTNSHARVVSSNSSSMYVTMIDGAFGYNTRNGEIKINIVNPGSGYAQNASVVISGGTYTNVAVASNGGIGTVAANASGRITSAPLTYSGNNYTVEPTVTITGNNYLPLVGNTLAVVNGTPGVYEGFLVTGQYTSYLANGDLVYYYVPAGNTAITGLVNATPYFVVNTTPYISGNLTFVGTLQLSASYNGNAINVSTGNTTAQIHILKGEDATAEAVIVVNETIKGDVTGATATVTSINNPDIDKFSGDILFYDYVTPITRSNTTTEVAKFILIV